VRVIVATRNQGKVKELSRLFALPSLTLVSLDDLPPIADVIEDADSFEGNARKKAWETALALGLPALADDSGLAVDALNGAPGIYSARYAGARGIHSTRFAGQHGNDGANVDKLLHEMRDVPDSQRGARFVCALAFADPTGALGKAIHCTHGTIEGRVLRARQGNGGFGYDPILIPTGESLSMAELSIERKNQLSHRAQAAQQMRDFLRSYIR
jgi:XTP/dITP diphosphohydrolase